MGRPLGVGDPSERASSLVTDLRDGRARTLSLVDGLTAEQLIGPKLDIVNPLLWEIGHLAWFQERWMLRRGGGASLRPDADALYDSMQVAHDTRWSLPLPTLDGTLTYMRGVLERSVERILADADRDEETCYFARLVTYHEDMHAEAFTYTRQTLGYPAPRPHRSPTMIEANDSPSAGGEPTSAENRSSGVGAGPIAGDVSIPGGSFLLGASRDLPFVFDNEKWAHPVEVAPFRIARGAVTQLEFSKFVEAGGYADRAHWDDTGWRWRQRAGAEHPVYWKRAAGGGWLRRHFDHWLPLEPHRAVIHLNRHEAEAYCRWAGRRLPSEAEWEMAASCALDSMSPRRAGGRTPEPGTSDGETGTHPPLGKRIYPWGAEPPSEDLANLDARASGCIDVGALPDGDSPHGCRQMLGNVWEWTATDFAPYPGFVADPYREYSEPWFDGAHKVLRGGCWATRSRLIRTTWRNFYTADRRDVFAGFRTCAL